MQRPMTPSWYSTWPPESNLILKIADSMSNESPKKTLQDAHAYYRNQSPNRWRISVCSSIQAAAGAVERARVRHLARHPEVYSNLFRTVDILNESPNKALKYSCTHFYLLMGTSSYNKGRKVQTGVHECIRENHPWVTRGPPTNANWCRF